jgi:hypothetical protein
MTSSTTDRRLGLTGGVPFKKPAKAGTTANITLSGNQSIDGYSTSSGDRVLVMNQTDQTANGVYTADSATWSRDLDFDGSGDVCQGTMVYVINGSSNGNKFFQVTSADTMTIGTSNITFSAVSVAFSGLSANAVATSNIQANAVTYAKVQQAAANTVLGNPTAATANISETALSNSQLLGRGASGNIAAISIGGGMSMSGTTLSSTTSLTASQFRLTLTTLTPVTTSDVTAAATIYVSPYTGNAVNINGTSYTASELSLALDSNAGHTGYHQSGKNFDLFAYISSGTTVAIGTGPAWTSDTARGTGAGTTEIQRTNGVWNNKNSITLRIGTAVGDTVSVAAGLATYIGSFRTTADGQTEDSAAKRFVWNCYNRAVRFMKVTDTTDTWTYSTASYRQANGAAGNQIDMLIGLSEDAVRVQVIGRAVSSTATGRSVAVGIGIDSTTVNSATIFDDATSSSSIGGAPHAHYRGFPGLGRHFLTWLEYGAGTDTQTWSGDSGVAYIQTGIVGEVAA